MLERRVIQFTLDIAVETDEDEFHAFCPGLKGLHTSGKTEEEAVQNAADAAIAYLESLIKHGDPIPLTVRVIESGGGDWPHTFQKPHVQTHEKRLAVPVA